MKRDTFTSLFKDLISHLYDHTVVETLPLAAYFPMPQNASMRRAEFIQQLVRNEIEQLRPSEGEPVYQLPEWRPYLILYKRYILGESPKDIASALYIGERQFRRDHSRALQALSIRMWERHFCPPEAQTAQQFVQQPVPVTEEDFALRPEILNLREVLQGVERIMSQRLQSEHIHLAFNLPKESISVLADRVLLRQIVLSLLNYALHLCAGQRLNMHLERRAESAIVGICFDVEEQWESVLEDEKDLLDFVRAWSRRMQVRLEEAYPPRGQRGEVVLRLSFPPVQHRTVLVVDDQPATLKMFERYLSRTGIEVIGVTDPAQVLDLARKIRPALITLDVMMPHLDGWEVLQSLQLDASTCHIPVLVCSAWDEPELAYSLGAAAFLKKPILQKALLDVLFQLNLMQE